MSDNVRFQKKPISNRMLLINIDESNIQNFEEKIFIQKYKQIYQQLTVAETRLREISNEIYKLTTSKGINYTEEIKVLKEERYKANNNCNKYDQQLRNLEGKEIFKSLVDRERYKSQSQREIIDELAFASWSEIKGMQKTSDSIHVRHTESLQKRTEPPVQVKTKAGEEKKNNAKGNYALFMLFLMNLSLTIPLIMINAPIWLIAVITFFVFSPAIFGSYTYSTLYTFIYNIARPVLYVWGLVVTIGGKQDFFAIAFYILAALQLTDIIKKFIGTVMLIVVALTERND